MEEEDNGKLIRYWNCPSQFIPESVNVWFRIYQYHKDFPGATMPGVTEQTPRFLKAYYLYESCMAQYKKETNSGSR